MIKLSITRIAVIGINYSFSWFKRTINYFLSVLSIFYTLINTAKNYQKLINNCSSYFNILTMHPKKSHVEEVEQIQIKYSAILFRRMALFKILIPIKVSSYKTFIDKHIFSFFSIPLHTII